MSVIKVLRDLNGLFNYSTDENPTSQQDYQKAVKNWVKTIVSLVDAVMWQPETEYTVGSQLLTPSLPYYVLRCTVAGTSGAAEPDYTDVALGDEITDGTVTWVVDGYFPLSGGRITGDVDITGDLSVSGAIYSSSGGVLPGTVTAFSGTFKDGYPVNKNTGLVDKEWHLCDGTNGTPDLRNRFIYGGNGTNNGATGGEASVTLSIAQIPKHYFSGTTSTSGSHNHWFSSARDVNQADRKTTKYEDTGDFRRTRAWLKDDHTGDAGNHDHTFTTNTLGGDQPHNNMPPYYTLAYIVKL